MTTGQTQANRRWYDSQPETSQFMASIQIFPDKIQTILCQGIMDTAEREFRIKEMLESVRSLGPENVTILLKSQSKHRHVDRNNQLHRALTTFTILPQGSRFAMVEKSNGVIQITRDYLGICRDFKHNPTLPDIARVTNKFLEDGKELTHQYLSELRTLFALRLAEVEVGSMQVKPERIAPPKPPSGGLVIDDDEMRIRPDNL